jgi:hypothetical protein
LCFSCCFPSLARTGRAIDKLVPTIGLDTSSVQMVAITVRYFDGDDKLIARHPGFQTQPCH